MRRAHVEVGFQVAGSHPWLGARRARLAGRLHNCNLVVPGRQAAAAALVVMLARRRRARGGSFDPGLHTDNGPLEPRGPRDVPVGFNEGLDETWEEDEEQVDDEDADIPGAELLVRNNNNRVNSPENVFPVADPQFVDNGDLLYSVSLERYASVRASGGAVMQDLPSEWLDRFACSVKAESFPQISNLYARVGIMIDINFDDYTIFGGDDDYLAGVTLKELSLSKARQVYLATGLPTIVESTEFEIVGDGRRLCYIQAWNMDDDVVEKNIQQIQDSTGIGQGSAGRRAFFKSTAAYCDGKNDFVTEGSVEMDLVFASPLKSAIARYTALDNLYRELNSVFDFDLGYFENMAQNSQPDPQDTETLVGGRMLRDRILRDGQVLRDGILKVSSFLNHQVDTRLMDLCGIELAERLRETMPNKILTVEATGLIPALSVGRRLEMPVVFARKSRPLTISDSYQTMYRSATKGTMSELIVSTEYLSSSDRVLIIDDFLAGGSTAEALCKLARMSRATIVGVGVLIEKSEGGGRASLSGYDFPVVSLVRIDSLAGGRIQIAEIEPLTTNG